MKTIQSSISKGQQSATLTRILEVDGHKVRLTIKSDAYEFQCRATAEVWHAPSLAWNAVHHIPAGLMATPKGLGYARGLTEAPFEADATELLKVARQILA